MKVVLSKATRKMQEQEAKTQNMSIDEILNRDALVAEVNWITLRAFGSFGIGDLPVGKFIHKKGEDICSRSLVQV